MSKVDKDNYKGNTKLPVEYNDAHAALRGYANSTLRSSLVLSAGMNPRLYSYIENFDDFYPDSEGFIKKQITLKVSDFRSAAIQSKMLAKKGIWISEYRVESGLNCGGHAFATQGYLMGPILHEFRVRRDQMIAESHELLVAALKRKNRPFPAEPMEVRFTAQGGVGTHEEHEFLLKEYELDSVGWGSPFLLVPEVTNVDEATRELLSKATEDDLYLSHISPLGIPFNNLRNNSKDLEKEENIQRGKPGSPCTKRYAALSQEYTPKGTCTASVEYQRKKIKELKDRKPDQETYQREYRKIVDRACICVGLGTTPLLIHGMDTSYEGNTVSICPGPNMAYFSEVTTLKGMVDHIYGKKLLPVRADRPHFFIKELEMFIKYLKEKISESKDPYSGITPEYLASFRDNLLEGIQYYRDYFSNTHWFASSREKLFADLDSWEKELV